MERIEHLPFGLDIVYENLADEHGRVYLGDSTTTTYGSSSHGHGIPTRDDYPPYKTSSSKKRKFRETVSTDGNTGYYCYNETSPDRDSGISLASSDSDDGDSSSGNTPAIQRKRPNRLDELKWGSDSNFCFHGYSLPLGQWTEDRLTQNLMRSVAPLCNNIVNTNSLFTRETDSEAKHNRSRRTPINGLPITENLKNTKEQPDYEEDEDTQITTQNHPLLMALGIGKDPGRPTAAAAAAAAGEDNDSNHGYHQHERGNVQKRRCLLRGHSMCHCQKEKNRRETIKEQFDELGRAVPGLSGRVFTRREALKQTAAYVENMTDGNRVLRQQLEELKKAQDGA